jgi:imidazoleglycerol-phosphate dehydratase/histidinol-phosphatase
MQKVLFLDRDGTLVLEPPEDYQLDSFEKLEFYPEVFRWLGRIVRELDYELVMVTNQDGLGTDSFPEASFWGPHNLILKAFANEGIHFKEVLIDRSFPEDNQPTRKPGVGMFGAYVTGEYDLAASYVIGDRLTDIELARNLGGQGIWLSNEPELGADEVQSEEGQVRSALALTTTSWEEIYDYLRKQNRTATVERETRETKIQVQLDLDGKGTADIHTGLHFFDHMLEQIARHAEVDLFIRTEGDLQVDEHHTIEDTALVLGEVFRKALGDKRGIQRYGFCLPMDDALAQVALDLVAVPGLFGRQHFDARRSETCPLRCSSTSLNPSLTQPNVT